jgi:hypothetical protein
MSRGNFMAMAPDGRDGRDHPQRTQLNDELHARPHMRITTPARVTHLAHLTGELGPIMPICWRYAAMSACRCRDRSYGRCSCWSMAAP